MVSGRLLEATGRAETEPVDLSGTRRIARRRVDIGTDLGEERGLLRHREATAGWTSGLGMLRLDVEDQESVLLVRMACAAGSGEVTTTCKDKLEVTA